MKEVTASKMVRRNQVDEMTTQDPNRYGWRVKNMQNGTAMRERNERISALTTIMTVSSS
tara:strand:- start:10570 stop:10746 length:177 start_codon:yes stop_codon:yes gene_type:complete